MTKTMRVLLAAAIALGGLFGFAGVASAQNDRQCNNEGFARATDNVDGDPAQTNDGGNCLNEGDSEGQVDQNGSASSGDGVAGQVAGVVSAGDASVDATNRSDDVEVETGNATGTNTADLHVRAGIGFDGGPNNRQCNSEGFAQLDDNATGSPAQTNDGNCANVGDAEGEVGQSADAASGDGVGGQVIGVVTSAGGSADLVLSNESTDSEVESGEGDFSNDTNTFADSGIFFDVAP